MFQNIQLVNRRIDQDGYDEFLMRVNDTGLPGGYTHFKLKSQHRLHVIPALITLYQSRKLNVADGLARYYYSLYYTNGIRYVSQVINADLPSLGLTYERRYASCVLRKIERLNWAYRGMKYKTAL